MLLLHSFRLLLTSVAARMAALAPTDNGQGPPGSREAPPTPRPELDRPGRWVPLFGTTELLRHISGRQRDRQACLRRPEPTRRLDLHQG